VEQSFQGSFVTQGRKNILTTALGTKEHPDRVWTTGYGVGVRQYFGSALRSSSSDNADIMMEISRLQYEFTSQLEEKLTSQIEQKIRDKLKDELRQEIRRGLEELSQQHTPLQEGVVLPTCGRDSRKGSCAAEDEEEDTNTDTSYRCKLYVGDPPRLVVIERVFPAYSTLHIVPLGDDFARVVIEEVKKADAEVSVPTLEVTLVGEALGTFIAWLTHLLHAISERTRVL